MAAGIGTGADRRMPGCTNQIRIVVIAIGEMRALPEKEIPSIFRLEFRPIPIQVVSAELIE